MLHVLDGRAPAGLAQGLPQVGTVPYGGGGAAERAGPRLVREGTAAHQCVDAVAVPLGGAQPFEQQGPDSLAQPVLQPLGGQGALQQRALPALPGHHQHRVAGAGPQRGQRVREGDEGGRVGGLQSEGASAQPERRGDPCGDGAGHLPDPVVRGGTQPPAQHRAQLLLGLRGVLPRTGIGRAGGGPPQFAGVAAAFDAQRVGVLPVQSEAGADDDVGAVPVQGAVRAAGVLQAAAGRLQHQQLEACHRPGLGRRDAEAGDVDPHPVQPGTGHLAVRAAGAAHGVRAALAVPAVRGAGAVLGGRVVGVVGVVRDVRVVRAAGQQPPEVGEVSGLGVQSGDPHDRHGLSGRFRVLFRRAARLRCGVHEVATPESVRWCAEWLRRKMWVRGRRKTDPLGCPHAGRAASKRPSTSSSE
ncbi:hypothetical protein STAL104432_14150 [Streptomyces albus]